MIVAQRSSTKSDKFYLVSRTRCALLCHTQFFFFYNSLFFFISNGWTTWKWRANKHVRIKKYFFLLCIVMRLCVEVVYCILDLVACMFDRPLLLFNLSEMLSMFNCYSFLFFFSSSSIVVTGKKLSVDNMRPPTATSFVIFLSSNSHFRVLLMSSIFSLFSFL